MAPTHFISLRIPQSTAPSKCRAFFEHALSQDLSGAGPKLRLIRPEQYHLTLLTLTLPTLREQQQAVDKFNSLCNAVRGVFPPDDPLIVSFRGIHKFSDSILYAAPVESAAVDRLRVLAEDLRRTFRVRHYKFEPHCTLAKWGVVPQSVWRPFEKHDFGDYRLDRFELSVMERPLAPDGYYRSIAEIRF